MSDSSSTWGPKLEKHPKPSSYWFFKLQLDVVSLWYLVGADACVSWLNTHQRRPTRPSLNCTKVDISANHPKSFRPHPMVGATTSPLTSKHGPSTPPPPRNPKYHIVSTAHWCREALAEMLTASSMHRLATKLSLLQPPAATNQGNPWWQKFPAQFHSLRTLDRSHRTYAKSQLFCILMWFLLYSHVVWWSLGLSDLWGLGIAPWPNFFFNVFLCIFFTFIYFWLRLDAENTSLPLFCLARVRIAVESISIVMRTSSI